MELDPNELHKLISAYYHKYEKFMLKNHRDLYMKFEKNNIHPPQKLGECVGIMKGAKHSDKDYAEIMRISREYCIANPFI